MACANSVSQAVCVLAALYSLQHVFVPTLLRSEHVSDSRSIVYSCCHQFCSSHQTVY